MLKIFNTVAAIVSLLALGLPLQGQEAKRASLFMVGYADSTRNLLRWAPVDPIAWQVGNKYGYTVERTTIARKGQVLEIPERKRLTLMPLKPYPVSLWEPVADTSDAAAAAAQSIFGEDPEGLGDGIWGMVNRAKSMDDRFSISMLCADQSFTVARMMGVGLADTAVKAGEDYVYRVFFSYTPDSTMLRDTAYCHLQGGARTELPRPFLVTAEARDNGQVMVSWPTEVFYGIFTYYQVERSLDAGSTFSLLTNKPFVNVGKADDSNLFYLDSLPPTAYSAWYRVKGITPFGVAGPFSDTVMVAALPKGKQVPTIDTLILSDSTLQVRWSAPADLDKQGGTWSILATREVTKQWRVLAQGIPAARREATIPAVDEYFLYVRVLYRDKKGKEQLSLPMVCQRPDSIPPAPPTGLSGSVDSLGVAHLSWAPNPEPDMLGYRVFYSYNPEAEFVQATRELCEASAYTFATERRVLNRKVYFKVLAIDRRFNRSAFSSVLALRKEDAIPPSQPIVDVVGQQGDSLTLRLIPSSSADVAAHELRAELVERPGVAILLKAYKGQPVDTLLQLTAPAGRNRLTLVAIDSSGNRATSVPLTVVGSSRGAEASRATVGYRVEDGALIFTLGKEAKELAYAIIYLTSPETGQRTMVARLAPEGFPYRYGTLAINTKLTFTVSLLLGSGSTRWETLTVTY